MIVNSGHLTLLSEVLEVLFPKHSVLEKLEICEIMKPMLTEDNKLRNELSSIFPSLNNLQVNFSTVPNMTFNTTLKIDMKHISFKKLTLCNEARLDIGAADENWPLYLKSLTESSCAEHFFVGCNSNLETCFREKYEEAQCDSSHPTLEVHCNSIKCLHVKLLL